MPDRRTFLAGAAATSASAIFAAPSSYARIIGSNDRVRAAAVGVNSRGKLVSTSFAKIGADVAQVYDVDSRVEAEILGEFQKEGLSVPAFGKDFRRALDDKSIDLVIHTTPDHWHTPGALMTMASGKHVYVEKPCGHNAAEGELLVAAQTKTGLHVQMGNQQRSSFETGELIGRIRAGELGDIYRVETWYANARPLIAKATPKEVPDWLDWDLWQGPAPRREYFAPVVHYSWHWNWHWGTGEVCNNAAHELDIARWIIDQKYPEKVSVKAGRRFQRDNAWEMYDIMLAEFTFPGGIEVVWDGSSCNRVDKFGRGRGTLAYGTKGSVIVDRAGYEIFNLQGKSIAKSDSGKDAGRRSGEALTELHALNLVEVIQGKQNALNSPIEEGAASTLMCHLANSAYRADIDLTVDPHTGHIAEPAAAPFHSRSYEPGWMPSV